MAASTTEIRQLIRADRTQPDSAAVAHVLTGTLFLGVGAVAAALAFISMSFPGFIPLGYGIWRAIAMLGLLVGFGTLTLVGGAYYVLPRLTGARLWNEPLAWLGLVITAATTAAGMIVVAVGWGDGREPFGLPWWLDIPLFVGIGIPPLVAVLTLRNRTESQTFVTIPFVVTGLGGLPLVYLFGNLPSQTPVASTTADLFSGSAYLVLLVSIAIGLGHYAVVKQTEKPLAGRQLSHIAYWSLLFGAGWFGIAQIAGGPAPGWLGVIGAVLGLGLPVGLIAATANLLATLQGQWREDDHVEPVAMLSVAGLFFATVVGVLAALAGFRSTGNLVGFTPYWEGIVFGFALAVIPLLSGAAAIQAIPKMTGRGLYSQQAAARTVRLIVYGSGALVVLLVAAGLVAGYSWAGGSFTGAYSAVGEAWAPATATARLFLGAATLAGLVGALGAFSLVSVILRTLTEGPVTTQEVLVAKEEE
ncbi:MAG: cbb3-type cytochrome c oxidase subunit I [Acidimicrobiia bacterium]|nr:hypothetical protein [Acidimicrobiia bacterium]